MVEESNLLPIGREAGVLKGAIARSDLDLARCRRRDFKVIVHGNIPNVGCVESPNTFLDASRGEDDAVRGNIEVALWLLELIRLAERCVDICGSDEVDQVSCKLPSSVLALGELCGPDAVAMLLVKLIPLRQVLVIQRKYR